MGGGPISWSSKKQTVVALSSSKAKYVTLSFAARQVLWLRYLTQELGYKQEKASVIYCDNCGAVYCSQDPKSHSYIEICFHFIRHWIKENLIDVKYIAGIENIADITTKVLARPAHTKCVMALHLPLNPGGVLE
jgi:hypothetical protein